MKCWAGGEQGAINSAQRAREDCKKKVTLALKKAAETWCVGDEKLGKMFQAEGPAGAKAAWGECMQACLQNSSGCSVAGARGVSRRGW